ncbi:tetratricopeptide repeat protein [Pseudoleptotrichia goodfellowii]|jgi:putative tetratricopeptide repeat-containing domain protein|uniref:Tetratricopeptide repeat protein n=1 Tax=Pseudoleptotrichia goodfellowii F0264 TaxID=596323 RepID=D0GNL4_9FUSO|nr:tetratricopeptide repeat protein [Pseudoleptotrichia goodfellowii]EEY34336.1 tetratricopeptide repeat protein [Pseudoleptotrichia goodfellowii F0264]
MIKKKFGNLLTVVFLILGIQILSQARAATIGQIEQYKLKLKKYNIKKESSDILVKALQTENPSEVEKLLLKAVEADKRNYIAYELLGAYYQNEKYGNDIKKALEYYEKALEVNPDEEKIYLQLGENYIRANDYDKAANIYGQMKSRFSENSVKAEEMAVASAEYARSSKMAEKTHEEQALYSKKSDSFAGFVAPSAAFESGANGYTKERYDFEEDKKKAKEEILASLSYFENKQYEKGFQSFYENYSRYADVLDDGLIEETIKIIKKYNEEIKNTNKKLYRKNLKKFKELEI